MTEYEAYQEHIRYTHDTYCRIVKALAKRIAGKGLIFVGRYGTY